MCIRRETREKDRRSLAFPPVSKPHTHITYMLRQCTSIVYIYVFFTSLRTFCILQNKIKKFFFFYCFNIYISIILFIRGFPLTGLTRNRAPYVMVFFVFNDVIDRDRGPLLFVFPEH
jgi:hypothetical protein